MTDDTESQAIFEELHRIQVRESELLVRLEQLHITGQQARPTPAARDPGPRPFAIGDTVKVHARIVEGNKERIQIFEGVVIKRRKGEHSDATFTVRKVSYNVGVERTFPLHSPRVEKVEVVSSAKVRRARLFYLRPLRGKAARLKTIFQNRSKKATSNQAA